MIVKSVKAIGRAAGYVLDEEDRKVIGSGIVLVVAVLICVLTLAAAAGLAISIFEWVRFS